MVCFLPLLLFNDMCLHSHTHTHTPNLKNAEYTAWATRTIKSARYERLKQWEMLYKRNFNLTVIFLLHFCTQLKIPWLPKNIMSKWAVCMCVCMCVSMTSYSPVFQSMAPVQTRHLGPDYWSADGCHYRHCFLKPMPAGWWLEACCLSVLPIEASCLSTVCYWCSWLSSRCFSS